MTAIQVMLIDDDYKDITVWREDDGRFMVEARYWPLGDANTVDENGDFPQPERHEFSEYMSKDDALKFAENQ